MHMIGATVSGLTGSGLVLQLNGGSDLAISENGAVTFATGVGSGARYAVTVKVQPSQPLQTCSVANGTGTVRAADISGIAVTCVTTLTSLYSFGGQGTSGPDGASPNGSLVEGQDGSLYGTTSMNGPIGVGMVFRITTAGEETTLYSIPFSDVGSPQTGLFLASDGNFYGTTPGGGGGSFTSGIVYRVTPAGAGELIYTFGGNDAGDLPVIGGLIQKSYGFLYDSIACSNVFRMSTTGAQETVTSSIAPGGCVSASFLQAQDGNLYAPTTNGVIKVSATPLDIL